MTIEQARRRANLLQGTLDMLILRTLLYGPMHGHQIGKNIQRTTNDFLQWVTTSSTIRFARLWE
jgi:DNA-binding PadR family transcriptional regulator